MHHKLKWIFQTLKKKKCLLNLNMIKCLVSFGVFKYFFMYKSCKFIILSGPEDVMQKNPKDIGNHKGLNTRSDRKFSYLRPLEVKPKDERKIKKTVFHHFSNKLSVTHGKSYTIYNLCSINSYLTTILHSTFISQRFENELMNNDFGKDILKAAINKGKIQMKILCMKIIMKVKNIDNLEELGTVIDAKSPIENVFDKLLWYDRTTIKYLNITKSMSHEDVKKLIEQQKYQNMNSMIIITPKEPLKIKIKNIPTNIDLGGNSYKLSSIIQQKSLTYSKLFHFNVIVKNPIVDKFTLIDDVNKTTSNYITNTVQLKMAVYVVP